MRTVNEITKDLVIQYRNELIRELNKIDIRLRNCTIQNIIQQVCEYFQLSEDVITIKTRKREIVQARQIAMYFSKQLTKNSLAEIGSRIGGKDHATVLHAIKTVNNLIETDSSFAYDIKQIEYKLFPLKKSA